MTTIHYPSAMKALCNKVSEPNIPLSFTLTDIDRAAIGWAVPRARKAHHTAGRYMIWWHAQKNAWVVIKFLEAKNQVSMILKTPLFAYSTFLDNHRMKESIELTNSTREEEL